ncbi:hypothetical protein [Tengunoibacter tsumagoiensis]|uniref:Uncharacterized protein n=1 Tax=Tengunoibacter tsumagoiensis TaxID=2014871 RepID=A0A401ZWT8_9CHLR|nr:hypothetical protein [Tengunoibacter tsumagoiensis]GCE11327.1 hypothetical protein KTT_11860 [Tengunoibacter tsumagoiensis]
MMACQYCQRGSVEQGEICPFCGLPFFEKLKQEDKSDHSEEGQIDAIPQLSFDEHLLDQTNSLTRPETGQVSLGPLASSLSSQIPALYQSIPLPPEQTEHQNTLALQLVPEHILEQLQPVEQPEIVYIRPDYPALRPLIPRYRIISGLLSILIVSIFLCAGTSYYVKTSGLLDRAGQFLWGQKLQSVNAVAPQLPDPPTPSTGDFGAPEVRAIIPSVAISARVDRLNLPIKVDTVFKPDQELYLTCNVQPPAGGGIVMAKWYINGHFFKSSELINVPVARNLAIPMLYLTPAEGYVELYWNMQLVQRLYFVVRA